MKTAPLPPNELERLAALARYHILDTPAEPAFDDLARLAAQLCRVPTALITLLDDHRQWFKSHIGWDCAQTPRDLSFCAHAILHDQLLVIPDLQADERFADNPLVAGEPHFRFYAGMPLMTPDGFRLGTLAVLDRQPAQLDDLQCDTLRTLAHQVVTQLERRRHLDDLARAVQTHQQVEQRLRNSESFFVTLVESLPQNIIRKDAQGRFTFANQKFCQTVGRPLESLIGKTDFDLFPQDLAAKYHRDDLRVMATQENLDTVEAHQTSTGEKLFVHVLKTPLYDASGGVVGIQGIFWDVTHRKRIEEALAYERDLLRALLDNIPDRIYFKDVHSRFLRCSKSMAEALGLSNAKQVIDMTDFDFDPQTRAQESYNEEQRVILTGQPSINKLEKNTDSTGAESWSAVTRVPIYNQAGAVTGIIGISRDITQLKRAERELEKTRDAALESARVKSQFLANMSHEIRTPMNAITGMSSLLKRTLLTPEQQEYAETISDSTATLLAIINEILDYSKLEAGKVRLEQIPFNLLQAVESTTRMVADPAQQKGLELACWIHPEVPPHLLGDPGRLRQILANLLSNGIKFTVQGQVLVKVNPVQLTPTTSTLRFEVIDTGIGIATQAIPEIFQAFHQADGSTTRKYGGTGLGLTITKYLIELMGGELGVESQPGQGSCFWFILPFQNDPAPQPSPLPIPRGKRILVVDDSATQRQILLDSLVAWNLLAVPAASHVEAVQLATDANHQGQPFDVVLIDMDMPEGPGLNLATLLKSNVATAHCRLVALSSFQGMTSLKDMRATGFSGRLIKPIGQSRLRKCLVQLLGTDRAAAFESLEPDQETSYLEYPDLPHPSPVRILLAEDNLINQRVALSQLKKLGYSADAVVNGAQVLEAVKRQPYDIILMDCQMPEMDGYEASRLLRSAEKPPDAPGAPAPYIIALTANTLEGDRERCLSAGMNDYLSKPININDLDAQIKRAITHLHPGTSTLLVPNLPDPLDRTVLRTLRMLKSDQDPDPLPGLIELYLKDAQPRLAIIESALAENAPARAASAAHSLKGSSNNLGARRLGELCSQLEKEAKSSNLAAAQQLWPSIQEEFLRVKTALIEASPP